MGCFSFARIPKKAFGILIFVLVIVLCLFGASIDLLLNPWIRELQLEWWNLFTTQHYSAWLYSINFTAWLLLTLSIAAVLGLALPLTRKWYLKA
jgi:hypothetical protein